MYQTVDAMRGGFRAYQFKQDIKTWDILKSKNGFNWLDITQAVDLSNDR